MNKQVGGVFLREKFCQILMQAFEQNMTTIHISERGTIVFEKMKRFKCKKMQMQSCLTKEEILQLMHYIKLVTKVELYGIKPCNYNIVVSGHNLQLQICCIPSMYFECIVVRFVRYNCVRSSTQNTKVKYMI